MACGISNCQFCYKTPKAEKLLCVFEIRKLMYFNHPHLIINTGLHFLSLQKKINIFYNKHKKYAIDSINMKTIYFNKGIIVTISKLLKHFPNPVT